MTPAQTTAMFEALSIELEMIGEGVDGLAALISEHVRQAPVEARPQALVQAQALDDLIQRLDALRVLAGGLARGEPVEAALDGVLLAALADRLRGAVLLSAPAVRSTPVGGDLMLFD